CSDVGITLQVPGLVEQVVRVTPFSFSMTPVLIMVQSTGQLPGADGLSDVSIGAQVGSFVKQQLTLHLGRIGQDGLIGQTQQFDITDLVAPAPRQTQIVDAQTVLLFHDLVIGTVAHETHDVETGAPVDEVVAPSGQQHVVQTIPDQCVIAVARQQIAEGVRVIDTEAD